MAQLSFFSAEANPPRVADLAGLLCGPGRVARFGSGAAARLSVAVADPWRASAVAAELRARGIAVETGPGDDSDTVLCTAFRADLAPLAGHWLAAGAKVVPDGFRPDGAALRLWALAAGVAGERDYTLALDPLARHTHQPLVGALRRAGLPADLAGPAPVLRLRGSRRLHRLAELVGAPPRGGGGCWPARQDCGLGSAQPCLPSSSALPAPKQPGTR